MAKLIQHRVLQTRKPKRRYASIAALSFALAGFLAAVSINRADTLYVQETTYIQKYTAPGPGSTFTSAENFANGLAFDNAGNLYVANFGSNNILKFTPAGVGSVFASSGLTNVQGLAFDGTGNLYVANTGNDTIQKFTPAGVGSVFAIAAQGQAHPTGGLAFDAGGNLYAVERWNTNEIHGDNYFVEKFTPGGVGTIFAHPFGIPYGLAVDGADNLYVADYVANAVIKFTPGGVRSTFASVGLNNPWGLAFDSAGYLYAANFSGSIMKFAPNGAPSVFASYPDVHHPTYIAIQPGLSVFVTLIARQSGSDVILSWPTNALGYTLQSAPGLTPPVEWIDSTNTPAIVGDSFTITNAPAAGSQIYRLRR